MKTICPSIATLNVGAGATGYQAFFGAISAAIATEAQAEIPVRVAGVFSKMWISVLANTRTTAGTARFRIDTGGGPGDGNQTFSITALTTGDFQDASNTDTVAAGSRVDMSITSGTGGSSFTYTGPSVVFDVAGVQAQNRVSSSGIPTGSAASTTYYFGIGGSTSLVTSEAQVQQIARTALTLKNFATYVVTNARSTTTTSGSRVNTANGNLAVSIGASATGLFEDTGNSDTVASGIPIDAFLTTGTGTGDIITSFIGYEVLAADGSFILYNGTAAGTAVNLSTTTYFSASGRLSANTTETQRRVLASVPFVATRLQVYVSANTVTATTTVNFRRGTSNDMNVSIGSSATGLFEDTTNSSSVVATDYINYQVVTGGSGTSCTFTFMSVHARTPLGAVVMHDYRKRRVA